MAYKEKRGERLRHALKVVGTEGKALLIGFPSRQQAEDWRKVWRCCSPAELRAGRWGAAPPGAAVAVGDGRSGVVLGVLPGGRRPHGVRGCSARLPFAR